MFTQPRTPPAALILPPQAPSTWESNFNWLPDRGGLRLEPYSKKAGHKRGAQVQIVFYKSPLWGICVYPRPLICCWGSLGKREKRGRKVDQRGWFKRGRKRVFVLLLEPPGRLKEGEKDIRTRGIETCVYCFMGLFPAFNIITATCNLFRLWRKTKLVSLLCKSTIFGSFQLNKLF